MTQKVQVAVVGGGIVGCSVLYCLARLGITDTVLLEKNELTSGSTWHAAGNTTFFGHYPSITELYINSVKTYLEAEAESGQSVSFHDAGSIRIANTPAELESYKKLEVAYEKLDIPYEVVGREKIESLHPLLNTEGMLGAAHTPTDGHLDASGACHAVAKCARMRGAEIKRNCDVERLEKTSAGWLLHTGDGVIEAEQVVMANSFWARELGASIGVNIPVFAVKHHALVTEDITELANLDFEVPTIRDSHGQYNMRQEGQGFLSGIYEADALFWALDGVPADFNQGLFEPELDRVEDNLEKVIERVPAFGAAGIKQVIYGAICYSPDALPLLGPVKQYPGLWLATGFSIGIGTGSGSADYLAQWMVNGRPPYDLPVVYPSRFGNNLTLDQNLQMIRKVYETGYRIGVGGGV
jgi:glycine/D-amino acid oxidase-like deaminating enzyme